MSARRRGKRIQIRPEAVEVPLGVDGTLSPNLPAELQPAVVGTGAPDTASDPEPGPPAATSKDVRDVERRLAELERLITERLDLSEQKDRLFNKLYAELEEARAERSLTALRPLLLDLIGVYDKLDAAAAAEPALRPLTDELAYVLEKQGVELILVDGEALDPSVQQVIGHIPEDEQGPDGHHRVVRSGWRIGTQVLRPQQVMMARRASA